MKAEGAGGGAEREGRVLETGPEAHSEEQGGPWTQEDRSAPPGGVVQSLRGGLTAEGFTTWSLVGNGRWPRMGKLLLETWRSVFLKAKKKSGQKGSSV